MKKDVERFKVEQFKLLFNQFPIGCICDSEEPDFIVDTGNYKIGIELTDLYWQNLPNQLPRQSQESLQLRIVDYAQKIYSNSDLPSIQVSVSFNKQYALKKKDVQRLSEAIVKIASRNIPSPGNYSYEEYDWDNRHYFPEELLSVSIWNIKNLDELSFRTASCDFVPSLSSNDVLSVLELKETKINSYRIKCDEVWLLISSNMFQLSTIFKYEEKVICKSYQSSFKRVFLLFHCEKKLYELNIYSSLV